MDKLRFLRIITVSTMLIVILLSTGSVSAISYSRYFGNASSSGACNGLSQLSSSDNCSSNKPVISNIGQLVVNTLSVIVGIVAVIMIIFAGFKYVTAAGDSNAINSARNVLIYAIIGLAIAVVARLIAADVLNSANSALHG